MLNKHTSTATILLVSFALHNKHNTRFNEYTFLNDKWHIYNSLIQFSHSLGHQESTATVKSCHMRLAVQKDE